MWQRKSMFGSHAILFTQCYFGSASCPLSIAQPASSLLPQSLGLCEKLGRKEEYQADQCSPPGLSNVRITLWPRRGGEGYSETEVEGLRKGQTLHFYFLTWQSFTRTPLSSISNIHRLYITILPHCLPQQTGCPNV